MCIYICSQKVYISNYKSWGCNVQHDYYRQQWFVIYLKIAKRVNPKSSHHKEKAFLFSLSLSLSLSVAYELMDIN